MKKDKKTTSYRRGLLCFADFNGYTKDSYTIFTVFYLYSGYKIGICQEYHLLQTLFLF